MLRSELIELNASVKLSGSSGRWAVPVVPASSAPLSTAQVFPQLSCITRQSTFPWQGSLEAACRCCSSRNSQSRPSSLFFPAHPQQCMQEVSSLVSLVCIPVSIHDVPLRALIDSGASENFISTDVVTSLNLPSHDLKCPSSLRIADGSVHNVTKFVRVRVAFGSLFIPLVLRVFQMSHQIILGFQFLQRFQPDIEWAAKCLNFVYRGLAVTLCSADKKHVRPSYGPRVTLSCLETTQPSLFRQTSNIVREYKSENKSTL